MQAQTPAEPTTTAQLKVLLITPFFKDAHRGLASAYKTAHQLAAHGMDVVVLTARTRGQAIFEEIDGLPVHRTRDFFFPDPFNFNIMPDLWPRVARLLKKEKPDIVLISKFVFFPILSAPLLRMKGQPFVITTDTFPGICWFSPFATRDRLVRWYTKTLGKWLVNLADALILLHDNLLPIAQELGFTRSVVIHGGVDAAAFEPHGPAAFLKKRPGEIIITYIGRLESVKGWNHILAAAKRIAKRRPNVRFVFVGYTQGKKVENTRQIQFAGFRRDIPAILAATDINVLFSKAEGLPNTVMEAMAAGVPVVASDVGGVSTQVKDRETGLLVTPGDVDGLVAALEDLIRDEKLRKRLGQAGREHVRKSFHWDAIAQQYDRLFREIIARSKGTGNG
jgi:glycosyltransferase involved in cell wall biosynthesis